MKERRVDLMLNDLLAKVMKCSYKKKQLLDTVERIRDGLVKLPECSKEVEDSFLKLKEEFLEICNNINTNLE